MVEHLVLVKLKAETTDEQRQAFFEALRGLKTAIPGIVDLTCGVNFSERSQGHHLGIMVRFQDRAALDAYIPNPIHQKVVTEYMRPIMESVTVVDYEF